MKEFKKTLIKLRGLIAISFGTSILITLAMVLLSVDWITYAVLFVALVVANLSVAIVVKALLDGREKKGEKK